MHTFLFVPLALLSVSLSPDSLDYVDLTLHRATDCVRAQVVVETPCRARTESTEAELRDRWREEGIPVWTDGDTLTAVFERDVASVDFCCSVQMPMSRFRGSDLWAVSVRVPNLEVALLGYGFVPSDGTRLEHR
ncbi:MAG: hypothetical protein AAF791_06925, partial [Bacteroidota bacterium]